MRQVCDLGATRLISLEAANYQVRASRRACRQYMLAVWRMAIIRFPKGCGRACGSKTLNRAHQSFLGFEWTTARWMAGLASNKATAMT